MYVNEFKDTVPFTTMSMTRAVLQGSLWRVMKSLSVQPTVGFGWVSSGKSMDLELSVGEVYLSYPTNPWNYVAIAKSVAFYQMKNISQWGITIGTQTEQIVDVGSDGYFNINVYDRTNANNFVTASCYTDDKSIYNKKMAVDTASIIIRPLTLPPNGICWKFDETFWEPGFYDSAKNQFTADFSFPSCDFEPSSLTYDMWMPEFNDGKSQVVTMINASNAAVMLSFTFYQTGMNYVRAMGNSFNVNVIPKKGIPNGSKSTYEYEFIPDYTHGTITLKIDGVAVRESTNIDFNMNIFVRVESLGGMDQYYTLTPEEFPPQPADHTGMCKVPNGYFPDIVAGSTNTLSTVTFAGTNNGHYGDIVSVIGYYAWPYKRYDEYVTAVEIDALKYADKTTGMIPPIIAKVAQSASGVWQLSAWYSGIPDSLVTKPIPSQMQSIVPYGKGYLSLSGSGCPLATASRNPPASLGPFTPTPAPSPSGGGSFFDIAIGLGVVGGLFLLMKGLK